MSTAGLPLNYTKNSGPAIRPGRMDTTWIYFLSLNHGERIKIGHSRQEQGKRIGQHSRMPTGEKLQVDMLCEVRGKPADEKTVQRYFAQFAVDGSDEVFWPKNELVEYVRWLRDQYFTAVAETTKSEREDLPIVSATDWLPNNNRRKPKANREPSLYDAVEAHEDSLCMGTREVTGDDFYTNQKVIEAAHRLMGGIDLDPASHVIANKVVRAERFYTISEDGLQQAWSGRVWLNPPFSAWKSWVPKILHEWSGRGISEMCVLSAMRTVTAQYFAPLLEACNAMCIMHGRIRFWGGVAGDSPDDGHAIFYFGDRKEQFRKEFDRLGTVFDGPKT